MSELSIVLIFFLSLSIMLAIVYFLVKSMLKTNREHLAALLEQVKESKEKIKLEKSLAAQKQLLPVRLQAYERLVLFLERINPPSLVIRCMQEAKSARQLHSVMLRTIREEFEHNNSQQLYVSAAGWNMVKTAKEEIVQLINLVAKDLNENSTTDEFAQQLVTQQAKMVDEAIDKLKSEVASLF